MRLSDLSIGTLLVNFGGDTWRSRFALFKEISNTCTIIIKWLLRHCADITPIPPNPKSKIRHARILTS